MRTIQERVDQAKRDAFLRSIPERASATGAEVGAGQLGDWLGLPYQDALSIVDDLEGEGFLYRDEPLNPPAGPIVHLTDLGTWAVERSRAA